MDMCVYRLVSYEYNSGVQNCKVRNNLETMDIGLNFYSYERPIKGVTLAKQACTPSPNRKHFEFLCYFESALQFYTTRTIMDK
jgi:hypothetical protein